MNTKDLRDSDEYDGHDDDDDEDDDDDDDDGDDEDENEDGGDDDYTGCLMPSPKCCFPKYHLASPDLCKH